jgi:hypothetical protein
VSTPVFWIVGVIALLFMWKGNFKVTMIGSALLATCLIGIAITTPTNKKK